MTEEETKKEIICDVHCRFFKVCEDANCLSYPGGPCTTFEGGKTAYEIGLENGGTYFDDERWAGEELPP